MNRLELPAGTPRAAAVLVHEGPAAARLGASLVDAGIAVLRLDAAATVDEVAGVAEEAGAELLVGHAAGGSTVLAASHRLPGVRAVVTVNAPAGESGAARTALLVLHAPTDEVIGVENARLIFDGARHPKSFIALDDADHLLTAPDAAHYAGELIRTWAARYLRPVPPPERIGSRVRVTESGAGPFRERITAGRHHLIADEPIPIGHDGGPTPYDLLLAGLGACTAMTLRMYADRKQLPLDQVTVDLRHSRVHTDDCEHCETADGLLDRIDLKLELTGDLTAEQRAKLLEIAGKCPVHRTLHSEIDVRTFLVP